MLTRSENTERELKRLELFMILMMNSVRYMKRPHTVPAAEKNDEALDRVTLDYLSKKQQTQLKDLLHRHRTLFSGKIKELKLVNM
ncbi:hypothetical protein TNCV_345671 [Trichonephila clavipes]|nr:hypothetical protein TNCV_345671 [Trichonephila clavipes]